MCVSLCPHVCAPVSTAFGAYFGLSVAFAMENLKIRALKVRVCPLCPRLRVPGLCIGILWCVCVCVTAGGG